MATFKLELTGEEAMALQQIVNGSSIKASAARVIASIQDKFDAAADVYNGASKAEQNSSPSDPPSTEPPRPDGDKGGEGSS